jgi:DNA-binding PadR family transcriptional regulator
MTPARADKQSPIQHLPLSPQVFQILVSLADGPRHGYAIIQEVAQRTDGGIRLTASTLYDALARLADQGCIDEVPPPADAAGRDSRRRYYRLSEMGREVAGLEARRLETVLETARERRLLPRRERH